MLMCLRRNLLIINILYFLNWKRMGKMMNVVSAVSGKKYRLVHVLAVVYV